MEAQSPGQEQETETKVQVDRKKLEAMITGEAPGESADAFFERVEKNTGVKICWPSRLKIRAKTKKDPFVKLIGMPQSIERAAQVIEEQLRAKKGRVILKIEVSHSLHSQIIGKGGRNTQQIMRDTNCHIHFPDSNKTLSNPSMAMNDQVSISGCAKDVETAREMIRAICPLTVTVTIQLGAGRNLYAIQPRLDPIHLQRHFPSGSDLSVQFVSQCPPLMGTLHFLMKSSGRNELEMLRAFGKVCQLIGVFPSGAELKFECQFELRPAALPSLGAVRWIAFRTNTQIQSSQQGLSISGPLEGIFIARKLLTVTSRIDAHFASIELNEFCLKGLLPVALHFERSSELHDSCQPTLSTMEMELDVQIGERKRRKGAKATREATDERDFVVCTYEANLFGAYTARNRLLLIKEPTKDQFPLDSESAAFMRSVCRESLMADQQQPLIAAAASVAFSNSAHLSFSHKETVGWKETAKKEDGTDKLGKFQERGEQHKWPDPLKSPIAAGLLAGVKGVNAQKSAVYNSSLTAFGRRNDHKELNPTNLWSVYPGGFSSSLPVDFLRVGRMSSDWPAEGQWRKGRPIVGRGTDEAKNGQQNGHNGRRTDRREKPFCHSVDKSGFSSRSSICSSSAFVNACGSYPLVVLHETAKESEEGKNELAESDKTTKKSEVETKAEITEPKVPMAEKAEIGRPKVPTAEKTEGQTKDEIDGNSTMPKTHPRVAALQMADHQRIKFAISAGTLFDHCSRTASTNGNCTVTELNHQQRQWENEQPMATGEERGAPPKWDIRTAGEPAFVLAQLGLAEHIAFFREQEIDMQAFLLLDEQCLQSLGVATIGARRKILHAILKLRDSALCHGMYSL